MDNPIIIIGPAGSGKTQKARKLTSAFGSNVVWIDGKQFTFHDPFLFKSCDEKTEIIVIDDIHDKNIIEHLYNSITRGIVVHKPHKNPFTIQPLFIITCDEKIKFEDIDCSSTRHRYDIFDYNFHVTYPKLK